MTDENGTEVVRPDTTNAGDSPFGDAPDTDDTPAVGADEQDPAEETERGQETPDDGESDADAGENAHADGLKVVVSIKGARATIGVQRPSSDPHIESFEDLDEAGLTQEVTAVIERARARWEESPKHPAYERPAPPARRGNRRQQGATVETETEQAQQQTLRLF